MYCQERRAKIRDILEDRPAVSIGELMSELGASHTTVARDLQALADRGDIIRSRGGAMRAAMHHSPARRDPEKRIERLADTAEALLANGKIEEAHTYALLASVRLRLLDLEQDGRTAVDSRSSCSPKGEESKHVPHLAVR